MVAAIKGVAVPSSTEEKELERGREILHALELSLSPEENVAYLTCLNTRYLLSIGVGAHPLDETRFLDKKRGIWNYGQRIGAACIYSSA